LDESEKEPPVNSKAALGERKKRSGKKKGRHLLKKAKRITRSEKGDRNLKIGAKKKPSEGKVKRGKNPPRLEKHTGPEGRGGGRPPENPALAEKGTVPKRKKEETQFLTLLGEIQKRGRKEREVHRRPSKRSIWRRKKGVRPKQKHDCKKTEATGEKRPKQKTPSRVIRRKGGLRRGGVIRKRGQEKNREISGD